MKFSYLMLLLFLTAEVSSQNSWPAKLQEYKFAKEIHKEDGMLGQVYCFLGLYREALPDARYSIDIDTIPSMDSLHISNRYLDSMRLKRIVILNEAHNINVTNRVFLYSILDSLKSIGFKDIFMEALSSDYDSDSLPQNKQYPTTGTGYYILEPVFGELVRKMLKQNMSLHAYEQEYDNYLDTVIKGDKTYIISKSRPDWIPVEADTSVLGYLYDPFWKRLVKQALNIYQAIMADKINKVFIYSGLGNGTKKTGRMGYILKHIMHVDPYFIDQTILTERSDSIYEDPVYRKFSNLKGYHYLIKTDGGTAHSLSNREGKVNDSVIDMLIGNPRTSYIHNRENWLELNGDRHRYPLSDYIDTCQLNSDFLVVVYYKDEYDNDGQSAIPADVIQVFKKNGEYDLVLRPSHTYRLFANMDGKTVVDKIISVP